jgi:nicotinate-nucleotide adenylyltransferase
LKSRWPLALPGARIGLLGGSFNPAHKGHLHISRVARRRLKLDQVWWLVSPQNPLKSKLGMAPLTDRVKMARKIAADPRIVVSDIETQLGTRFSVDTIRALQHHYPAVTFVWLMGSDNLAGFHHWHEWQKIARMVGIGVIARPCVAHALVSPFVRRFGFARTRPLSQPPAWRYLLSKLHPASATEIRATGRWRPDGKLS